MQSLRALLPSSGALIAFEAAGRHGSFTRAAEELAMTQAAVSFAIRNLERDLGVPLFTRRHRSIELTEAGERFHADVSLGLMHIRKSAEELKALGSDRHVTLSASTAFASYWMLPRLARFRQDLPCIDLRIQTSDRDVDLRMEGLPLGIRSGRPSVWPACQDALLAAEEITAVAGAGYAESFGLPESNAAIAEHRLIHLEEPFRPVVDWEDWFRDVGVSPPARGRGLLINDYVLVLQAVVGGQGIALGWKHLTDPMVEQGLLIEASDHIYRTGNGFHVVWPSDPPLSESAAMVRDWLLSDVDP